MITPAMQLYFTGESFRNVKQFLKLQGVKMSHVVVYKWIRKYVGLMENYLEKIKPNVGDAWRADELFNFVYVKLEPYSCCILLINYLFFSYIIIITSYSILRVSR
jgi:transposase-like protein